MPAPLPFKNTCIAVAAWIVTSFASASSCAEPQPPSPPSQSQAPSAPSFFSSIKALQARLMGARQSAPANDKGSTTQSSLAAADPAPTSDTVAVAATAKASAVPAAAAPRAMAQWVLDPSDGSVKRTLQRWSTDSGWQLVWELPVDFPVGAQAAFAGGFEEAVAAVAVSLQNSEMPMKAIFYRGNKVLRIVAKGVQ